MLKEELPIKRNELELDAMKGPKVKEREDLEKQISEYKKKGGKVTEYAPQQKRTSLVW